ncbi:hypothetical protein FBU30_011235 [Linnemannia zychae]|nr:hypothetical protein FBU30_011235 [Linnemannia zychae]
MSDQKDKMASATFLPASAIDKFIALQSRFRTSHSTIPHPSPSSSSREFKNLRSDAVPPTDTPTLVIQQELHRSIQQSGYQLSTPTYVTRLDTASVMNHSIKLDGIIRDSMDNTQSSNIKATLQERKHIDPPAIAPRKYDPISSPGSEEAHKYIVSSRILQKRQLIKALLDPSCGHISFIERDFEYLRTMDTVMMQNQDIISRVEADLILDEYTAVMFYSLNDFDRSNSLDDDDDDDEAGLHTLVKSLARIGPRYKSIWLIIEEYHSSTPNALTQPTPYTESIMRRLIMFMAWVPLTHSRLQWLSRIHYPNGHQYPQGASQPFRTGDLEKAIDEVPFQTQVLFASDEQCAASMTRSIGNGIVKQIDRAVKNKIRREEDGWRDADEWLWRDWLSDQDSNHERFLSTFQLFNPFSIQLILSLCTLKEFFAMDHQQRCRTVEHFRKIGGYANVLIKLSKI